VSGAATLSPEQLAAVAELWTRSGRELVVRLTGTSMEPAIPSGAEVRLLCGAAPGLGDVVARREGAGVLVHRVVALSADGVWMLTRGDARWLPDAPVRGTEGLLGCVSAVRGQAAFAPLAPPAASLGQRCVLWPLAAALRVHPGVGAALVSGLVRMRRLALRALAPLRHRLAAHRR
jgi:hypothetical protein